MASYTKADVQNANLPVADMLRRLDPKTHRGDKARFFNHVVRMGLASHGKTLTDKEVDSLASNLANNFTLFAQGRSDALRTGNDVSIADIKTAWAALANGTLNLGGTGNGNGNGNGGSNPPAPGSSTSTNPAQPGETKTDVPPVSQNVFASALKVFDGLRTRAEGFTIPTSVDDAYEMLWDHLAEPVKDGRASGVISDTLARLVATDRNLFNGIITVLPDDARLAIEEALIDRAYDAYKVSLKTTVEDVYHIGVGKRHAADMFVQWGPQVARITSWMGKDEGLGWQPTPDQIREANRDHAVAAFRVLAEGLRAEVAAAMPAPVPAPEMQPIQFNTIMERLLSKGPEVLREVGGRWGKMSTQEQHEFVANLDREEAEAAKAQAETQDQPAETTATEPKAEAPETPPANRPNRQTKA